MRLGYACLNVTLGRTMRGLRLKTLRARGIAYLQGLVDENLALTADILRWNRAHDITICYPRRSGGGCAWRTTSAPGRCATSYRSAMSRGCR